MLYTKPQEPGIIDKLPSSHQYMNLVLSDMNWRANVNTPVTEEGILMVGGGIPDHNILKKPAVS